MALEAWKERAAALESEMYALYLAFRDSRTPLAAKAVIALLVAYAVSPVDPIPDFVPGLGYLDELFLLPLGVGVALWLTPDEVVEECRTRAGDEMAVGRARWVAAGVVVLVWLLVVALALRAFTDWP